MAERERTNRIQANLNNPLPPKVRSFTEQAQVHQREYPTGCADLACNTCAHLRPKKDRFELLDLD